VIFFRRNFFKNALLKTLRKLAGIGSSIKLCEIVAKLCGWVVRMCD